MRCPCIHWIFGQTFKPVITYVKPVITYVHYICTVFISKSLSKLLEGFEVCPAHFYHTWMSRVTEPPPGPKASANLGRFPQISLHAHGCTHSRVAPPPLRGIPCSCLLPGSAPAARHVCRVACHLPSRGREIIERAWSQPAASGPGGAHRWQVWLAANAAAG